MEESLYSPEIAALAALAVAAISGFVSYIVAKRATVVEDSAVRILKKMLRLGRRKYMTYEYIKRRIGGFEDDELRRLLVRSGAARFFLTYRDVFLPNIDEKSFLDMADDHLRTRVETSLKQSVEVWSLIDLPFLSINRATLGTAEFSGSLMFSPELGNPDFIDQMGGR